MTFPCPKCSHPLSRVMESRSTDLGYKRRRRECLHQQCKHRFSTFEVWQKPLNYDGLIIELSDLHYEAIDLENRLYRLLFETFPDKFPQRIEPQTPDACHQNNSGIEL